MKKLIAFDLDGTLAPSKSTLPARMATLMNQLLTTHHICIISGGKYELFQRQVLTQITQDPELLAKMHLMPTSGTRYYTYKDGWNMNYAEDFTDEQKVQIVAALQAGFEESGFMPDKFYGETIEDRDSQITLSTIGQEVVAELGEEGLRIKHDWDPDGSKKMRIRDLVAARIPDFEVRSAGLTSIDVTKPGVDKAYGMQKLLEATGFTKEDVLFMGDKIMPGGNDYAVEQYGIDCIAVEDWKDTSYAIEAIVKTS